MTKEETIKALQSIEDRAIDFPYMTACDWVAIAAAKRHLREETVSSLDNSDMPVERWKQAVKAALNQRSYRSSKGLTETKDDYFVDGVQWADEHPKEEPVSEDLKRAAITAADEDMQGRQIMEESNENRQLYSRIFRRGFKAGAQWKEKNLLKAAGGEDLPEYDREVIVLTQPYPLKDGEFAVTFAHRPDPKGWEGKSITTGKVEHYTPKTYGKGGWNVDDVKWWLDIDFSKSMQNKK